MRLRRFWQDGTPAPEFGNGGRIDTNPDLHFSMSTLLVDPQARPILVGTTLDPPVRIPPPHFSYAPGPIYPSDATLLRFGRHGKLDPSFGGDGILQYNFGLTTDYPGADRPGVRASDAAIDSQGRLILVVSEEDLYNPVLGHPGVGVRDKLLVRLTPEGALDPSFGSGGMVPIEPGRSIREVAVGPKDDITLATAIEPNPEVGVLYELMRLTANGQRDPRFGKDGIAPYPGYALNAMAFDRRGRLLTLGWRPGKKRIDGIDTVRRILADGRLDPSFGENGVLRFDIRGPSRLNGIAADGGGFYLVGTLFLRRTPRQSWKSSHRKFIVFHRLESGRADRSFGRRGRVVTGFGRWIDAGAFTAANMPRNGLLVTGFAHGRRSKWIDPDTQLALAMYRGANRYR